MWLLGKSNSTLLEEKKYLLLPLDNPSLMRNRKRRSIQRESRWRNQSRLKNRRNLSRRRIERDGVKKRSVLKLVIPWSWQGLHGGTRKNTSAQGWMTLSPSKGKFSIPYIYLPHFISCISFRFPINLHCMIG